MSIRHPIAVFICMAMAMALLWSKALLTITAITLAVVASVDIQINPFRITWLLTPKTILRTFRTKPFIWVFSLLFGLYLVSIVYAGDLSEWWALTHVKIPFLIIPLSFAMLDPFSKKEYMIVALSMVILAVWSSIWVQVAYYSEYYLFNKSLGFGASLPTPGSHIRFSSIVAISVILCLGFAIENWKMKYHWERWVYGITAVYLFYFLHILSVRSGLMLGYAGILILSLFYVRYLTLWKKVVLIAILFTVPVIAYKTLPGLQLKVDYALYDLGKFKEGQGDNYSDAQRWESWRAGLTIGNRHPFFGAGTGNFRSELENYYKTESKTFMWRPQNQWINIFAIFGLFGLTVFLFTIIYPMTFALFWKPPLIPTLFMLQLVSMIVEHPLDTVVGTSFFLLFGLMGLSYQSGLIKTTAASDGKS